MQEGRKAWHWSQHEMGNISQSANTRNVCSVVFLCSQELPAAQTPLRHGKGQALGELWKMFYIRKSRCNLAATVIAPQALWALGEQSAALSQTLWAPLVIEQVRRTMSGVTPPACPICTAGAYTATFISSHSTGSAHEVRLLPPCNPEGRSGHRGCNYN